MFKLPELLCPAGSPAALDAALEGGADAVYLGGESMNARIHAGNFSPEALRAAVRRAHTYGTKVYLTLNTLVFDKELSAFADAARDAARAGVDALIVADLGGAMLLRRILPKTELHASTQMSGHNSLMGAELKSLGFSRMVAARELPARELCRLVEQSPIETEVFVHGALCVSCSGQCLFSSLVGGRSGNRGACAQPCRLPYRTLRGKGRESHPLSLKDLSLAAHVPALIDMGIASFKIEGRMKSPEYVYETARTWRRLLDERRAATPQELRQLSEAFSRGGFTDGYFTEHLGHSMLGVRSDADKQASRAIAPFAGLTRKRPIALSLTLQKDLPSVLTLSDGERRVSVTGASAQAARTSPMTKEAVERSIARFGNTPYRPQSIEIVMEDGLMVPVSALNDLRRRAVDALTEALQPAPQRILPGLPISELRGSRLQRCSASFARSEQITKNASESFERIYLPLFSHTSAANGVVLPPVIYDGQTDAVRAALQRAAEAGALYAMVGNLGHLPLVREAGLVPVGDLRLNLTNRESAAALFAMGFEELLLSPELTLPQMRDIGGNTAAVVYGRIPLMTLEKCVIRESSDCDHCHAGVAALTDRRGVSFPVLREWEHRNVIYNSLPTAMPDKQAELDRCGIVNRHFLFSVERAHEVDEVLEAYRIGRALTGAVRRI